MSDKGRLKDIYADIKGYDSPKSIWLISELDSEKQIFYVLSEPGDCTKYEYLVYRNYGYYTFMPYEQTGNKYPRNPITKYDVDINIIGEMYAHIAEKTYDCNAYTLVECIRTINQIELMLKIDNMKLEGYQIRKLNLIKYDWDSDCGRS